MHRLLAPIAALALLAAAAAADDRPTYLLFGGTAIDGRFWDRRSVPLVAEGAGQRQAGVALARLPYALPYGWRAGGEAGLSLRHDSGALGPGGTSLEVWAGPALRHDGLRLGRLLLRPGLTLGLSAVTASHGLERGRERAEEGEAALLYFMAPEIALARRSGRGPELVLRIQHRSGGKNVNLPALGDMGDTTNAHVVGLRWSF